MNPTPTVLLVMVLATSGCLTGSNSSARDVPDPITSAGGDGFPTTFSYDTAGAYDFQINDPIRLGSRTGDPPFFDFMPRANGTIVEAALEWDSAQDPGLRLMRYVGGQEWEVVATAEGPSPLLIEQAGLLSNATYSLEIVLAGVSGPLRWSLHVDITSMQEPAAG